MQSGAMNQLHLLANIFFSLILGANTFSYKDAKNWGKQHPGCNGKHQSPIIIVPNSSFDGFSKISQKLKLTDFHKVPTNMTIKNTGHTVEIKADWSGEPPRFTGGPLHGNYVFEKATFHWSQKNDEGGEHKIYDSPSKEVVIQEDIEMHMYFYKTDFKSFEKAQSRKGGLAVIAVSFKVVYNNLYKEEDLFLGDYKKLIGKLEKSLKEVKYINSTAVVPPFPLTSFVERTDVAMKEVLFYEGSLDYPPCSESVTWFIDEFNTYITSNLLKEFRKIKLAEGDVSNIRPLQALNGREVKMVYYE